MITEQAGKHRGKRKRENNNLPVQGALSKLDCNKNDFFYTHTETFRTSLLFPLAQPSPALTNAVLLSAWPPANLAGESPKHSPGHGLGLAGSPPPAPQRRGEARAFSLPGAFLRPAKINTRLLIKLLFLTSIGQKCQSYQAAPEDGAGTGLEGPSGLEEFLA